LNNKKQLLIDVSLCKHMLSGIAKNGFERDFTIELK